MFGDGFEKCFFFWLIWKCVLGCFVGFTFEEMSCVRFTKGNCLVLFQLKQILNMLIFKKRKIMFIILNGHLASFVITPNL